MAWSEVQIRSVAAEYALGVAEPADAAQFESLLLAKNPVASEELRAFEETAARLAFGTATEKPSYALKDKLMKGIRKSGFREELPGYQVLRAGEGSWRPTGETGVSMKVLAHDRERETATFLLKVDPGAVFPNHRHSVEEQCWVLEGDVRHVDGSLGMKAGDFFRATPGTDHPAFTSDNGCLLLIIGSAKDERVR